jgi:hypothetical protein
MTSPLRFAAHGAAPLQRAPVAEPCRTPHTLYAARNVRGTAPTASVCAGVDRPCPRLRRRGAGPAAVAARREFAVGTQPSRIGPVELAHFELATRLNVRRSHDAAQRAGMEHGRKYLDAQICSKYTWIFSPGQNIAKQLSTIPRTFCRPSYSPRCVRGRLGRRVSHRMAARRRAWPLTRPRVVAKGDPCFHGSDAEVRLVRAGAVTYGSLCHSPRARRQRSDLRRQCVQCDM